ncbi:MAG TPA: SURF1 family protein [Acidimicrobiia bacterium]
MALLAVAFVLLGFWQLDRHSQVRDANDEGRRRLAGEPVSLEEALDAADGDYESIRYTRVAVTGVYAPDDEVLIRSRVHPTLGAGFHVVTPLILEDGSAVLVNRGWVPLDMDTPPVAEAAPEPGELTVTGWVEPTQVRSAFGPADPAEGRLQRMNRIDVPRIARQLDYPVAPVYLVAEGVGEGLPEPVPPPTFDDLGPHLSYAIQWFAFAVIGLVGYGFLMRNRLRQTRARSSTTS